MKVLGRISVSVVMVLFLSSSLSYGQSTAIQYLSKGVDYAAQGKFKDAKEEFGKVSKADPLYSSIEENLKIIEDVIDKKIASKTAIHLFKGAAYLNKGQYDLAISDCNKAIELNSRLAMAYVTRGLAYYLGKAQYDLAISDYNKAIELNPRYAEVYNNRAVTYYLQEQYDKAWEDVYKAQSLGKQVHPGFIKALREASGRQE